MAHSVSIIKSKKLLKKIIEGGDTSMSTFFHSSPGIGKSAIIKQVADEMGMELIDIRLASIEATDLCGLPFVKDGEQVFSTPEWFPTDPNSKGILFLDELSNAPVNVQQAAYRLILDRETKTGNKLPDGWFTVAAGNLKTDRTGVKGILPALGNRFSVHINVEANVRDFVTYGIDAGIDSRVLGFVDFKPDHLHKCESGDVAFPTPRSWEFASKLLKLGLSNGELITALSGCVGEGTASEFLAFMKFYKDLPSFSKIMDGSVDFVVPTDNLGLVAAVTSSIITLLYQNHRDAKKCKNLQKLMIQLSDESLILIYKILSASDNNEMLLNVGEHTEESYNKVKKYFEND